MFDTGAEDTVLQAEAVSRLGLRVEKAPPDVAAVNGRVFVGKTAECETVIGAFTNRYRFNILPPAPADLEPDGAV